ncbi:MAG: hypothetical protein MUO25_13045 [Thermoanaerobaculaceae bacterium]|nr:hypothetical protein [Thermoanaerobaculaceae bacterium]
MKRVWQRLSPLAARVFPWPLLPICGRWVSGAASAGILLLVLLSRLLLLPDGAWEQDEALMACGVLDFDPARHMPLPPGFPLWVFIGKVVRKLAVGDPLQALQVASALFSVLGFWALVGLWEGVAGRRLALTGAALAAFLPGVWFHAARGFSETPSAALAIIGLALWLRGGRAGFTPGVVAMTCAALVRPPLAPFFVLAVVLAGWGVRREPRRLAAGALAAGAVLAAVMVPAALAAGGLGALVEVSALHAGQHLSTLGTESWAPESLGLVRGLGTPAVAVFFLALAAVGWWGWRRALAHRWWAATLAGVALVFLLVFADNRNYPRYWVLVWLLMATPAVAGAALLGRSRTAAATASSVGMLAAVWWTWPAMRHIHRNQLPVVAALRTVGAAGGALIYEDQLFSFRNLATLTGRLSLMSLRVTEMQRAGRGPVGAPLWLVAEGPGADLACPTSRVVEFECEQPRVRRLSQERFLNVRLVRDPVLVARGGSPVEFEGIHRFVWCGARTALLVPPVSGPGTLALTVEVHPRLGDAQAEARFAGVRTWSGRLSPGLRVISIPVPSPANTGRALWVDLDVEREARSPRDARALSLRIFVASLQAPPHFPRVLTFFPEAASLLLACAEAEGTYPPELIGNPPVPAAWTGAHAAFRFPAGEGLVGIELFTTRPEPTAVEVRLGSSRAQFTMGSAVTRVALPVPPELASIGRVQLELSSSTVVPGGGDTRALGVAVSRIWYQPSSPVPALAP